MNELALQTSGLSKHFGGLVAVDKIDLEVNHGELIGIAGPNGAGKTTLYNVLSGFLAPTEGDVFINGKDGTGKTPQEIVDLGLVRSFQSTRLASSLTVLENIMVAALYAQDMSRKEGRKYAREVAEKFDLEPIISGQADSLDLFQAKQLVFARLFATGADIFLFDEPFAGLNEDEIEELIPVIEMIHESNKTIMIIEHNFDSLVTFVERVIVLRQGEILADDDPDAVMNNPEVQETYIGE